jgi:hypothetical protein
MESHFKGEKIVMKCKDKEIAVYGSNCEIRFGISSWSDDCSSVKYSWPDKNGNSSRGGEFPVEALPQMIRMALKYGYLKPEEVFKA